MDQVQLIVILKATVKGALGGVQTGSASAATVADWQVMSGGDDEFRLEVQTKNGQLPLRGPAIQKDAKGRFFYIVWRGGEISRRAKIYVETITQEMLDSGSPLRVVLPGKAKDGLPCCATVQPLEDWKPIS